MLKWPHKVEGLTRKEILRAVRDPKWQAFREELKGLSTAEKLDRLHQYLITTTGWNVEIQVTNYINALRRSGVLNEHYEVVG